MHFLPELPLSVNPFALFGLLILLGLIGGEIAKRIRFLPTISGYIFIGFLVGPGGLNLVGQTVLTDARIFVDISLGLILFDIGRHLDFTWLKHDRNLLYTSLVESSLTFIFVFTLLYVLGLSWLPAMLAAIIAIATSPAVIMLVAHDLSSEGPVTRRTLILTSLNNLFAITLFTIVLPLTKTSPHTLALSSLILPSAYRLLGSLALGIIMFWVAKSIALLTGKYKQSQFIMFIGVVVLTISMAQTLLLSTMLTLFTLGVAARNWDYKHTLMEIDFGWLARLFIILLFVITGFQLNLHNLWYTVGTVVAFLLIRTFAKTIAICSFAKLSRLTWPQAFAISFALLPMAEVAVGMSSTLADFNPNLGKTLATIVTTTIAILQLVGPIATQLAFIKSGETSVDTPNN